MGGLLAVNKGSVDPPTFSILTWKPEGAVNSHPIVLVGKGVVYDTGGLSLKPTHDSMDYMKCDMAGAATTRHRTPMKNRIEMCFVLTFMTTPYKFPCCEFIMRGRNRYFTKFKRSSGFQPCFNQILSPRLHWPKTMQ